MLIITQITQLSLLAMEQRLQEAGELVALFQIQNFLTAAKEYQVAEEVVLEEVVLGAVY
jgi:hypothetical protein